ncbi:TRAP transporter large permease [Qaidamihabitans albus]|uniref:TRAP transporter large permease n=1 Tax=Qaidamihabitans albus TaxID=2795733 RepID=UPI0018F17F75|nr:TRAP transporter large permease [Qaidamihabitans albus]
MTEMVLVLVGCLLVLFLIGVPIPVSIGLSTVVVAAITGMPVSRLPQSMTSSLSQFPVLAIPLFVLAGKVMEHGGMSDRLVKLARALVGHLRGGLGYVSILAAMFFAALSGSAIATTVAIGSIMIPAMVKAGWNREFSSAVQAAGGTLGAMIPPSVPMVLYGVTASVSVGELFIAGILPGIFIGLTLMVVVWLRARRTSEQNLQIDERSDVAGLVASVRHAVLALGMPLIVLGGIYGGVFTPTEAAAVAALYGFLVSAVVYRQLTWRRIGEILNSTVVVTGALLFIIAVASFFSIWLTLQRVPYSIAQAFESSPLSGAVTLLLMLVFFLVVGMFMEASAALIISTPILLPVAVAMGMDPVHFGVFMIAALSIGMLTPPLGVGLFVAAQVGQTSFTSVVRPALPLIVMMIVGVVAILFIPPLSLALT